MSIQSAIIELNSIGYCLFLNGENIDYKYKGQNTPPKEKVVSLFESVKKHKPEAIKIIRATDKQIISNVEKYKNKSLDDFEKEVTLKKVYSKELNEVIYFSPNQETTNKYKNIKEVVYSVDELKQLIRSKVSGSELKAIHEAKKVFNGMILKNETERK